MSARDRLGGQRLSGGQGPRPGHAGGIGGIDPIPLTRARARARVALMRLIPPIPPDWRERCRRT
jgi:hypothetical protein